MEVGANIRKVRLAAGLTQQELADRCGLTKGMISKVENGVVAPALGTLTRIAAALKVKVAQLLESGGESGTMMTVNPFLDPAKFVMTELGYGIFAPAAGQGDRLMQPMMICTKCGEVKRHLVSHQGEEFLFIFEGEMNFAVGQDTHLLRKGDSLHFDALQKHGIVSVPNEVKYLDLFVGRQQGGNADHGGESAE